MDNVEHLDEYGDIDWDSLKAETGATAKQVRLARALHSGLEGEDLLRASGYNHATAVSRAKSNPAVKMMLTLAGSYAPDDDAPWETHDVLKRLKKIADKSTGQNAVNALVRYHEISQWYQEQERNREDDPTDLLKMLFTSGGVAARMFAAVYLAENEKGPSPAEIEALGLKFSESDWRVYRYHYPTLCRFLVEIAKEAPGLTGQRLAAMFSDVPGVRRELEASGRKFVRVNGHDSIEAVT